MVRTGEHLVGRAETCSVFDESLLGLAHGPPPAALALIGEPGIGKTRLLAEAAARADAHGYLVLRGAASELERDLPFWVFVDALDEHVRRLEPHSLDALDDETRDTLAVILPSLNPPAGSRAIAILHDRYRVHAAVRDLLERLAAVTPLVLLVDDLHWADTGVHRALRRPPPAPARRSHPRRSLPPSAAGARPTVRRARARAPLRRAATDRDRCAHAAAGARAPGRSGRRRDRAGDVRGERRQPLLPRATRPIARSSAARTFPRRSRRTWPRSSRSSATTRDSRSTARPWSGIPSTPSSRPQQAA